jgi:hypothetical protein
MELTLTVSDRGKNFSNEEIRSFSEILLLFTDLRILIDEGLVLRVSRYNLGVTRSLTIESSESFEFSDLRK